MENIQVENKWNICTDRIHLQLVDQSYAEAIFQEFTDEIAYYMLPKPAKTIADTLQFIQSSKLDFDAGKSFTVMITKVDSGEFLGCGGIHELDSRTPAFGIWIKKSAHGNKFGLEAVSALKKWAEKYLDYDYLIYPADKDNWPSRKIAESLGGVVFNEENCDSMTGRVLHLVNYHIPR